MESYMLRAPGFTWTHCGWLLLLVAAVGCGCSGINATQSISPLDFLLPGLHIQNDPPKPLPPTGTNVLVCWDGPALATAGR